MYVISSLNFFLKRDNEAGGTDSSFLFINSKSKHDLIFKNTKNEKAQQSVRKPLENGSEDNSHAYVCQNRYDH